ncbi:MAG: SDR family NAD(P)-dependent oxidoreductase, partial [Pyrinomonadaceae bacterium]
MRFDGKTVLVTGGALGIGRAVCEVIAERGGAVSIIDVDAKAGRETCTSIEASGGKAAFMPVDVSNFDAVQRAVDATHARFGSIDSLVVSAGIQRYGTAISTDEDQWTEVLGVNLKGAWNAARASIPF